MQRYCQLPGLRTARMRVHLAAAFVRYALVIPQGPRDLVMSRSAVRFRSSAPQLRLRNQAFATGGTSPAPKLESAPDNNATAAGDRRKSRGRGWVTIGRGREPPAGPQGAQIAPGRCGTSAPCPLDACGLQAAVRADLVARRRVATGFRGGRRPTDGSVGLRVSRRSAQKAGLPIPEHTRTRGGTDLWGKVRWGIGKIRPPGNVR